MITGDTGGVKTDEALVKEAQEGSAVSLEEIILRYRGYVAAIAKAYYIAGAEDEDIMQEGMIGLFKAVMDYKPEKKSSFKTFAAICVNAQLKTAIKSANRKKHGPLNSYVSLDKQAYDDTDDVTLMDTVVTPDNQNPENIVIDRENMDGINTELNKALSKLELEVLVCYLEGLSYQEIAERVNRDVKSVDNAIQRIKKKMESILK